MFMKVAVIVTTLIVSTQGWAIDDTLQDRAAEAERYLSTVSFREMFTDTSEQWALMLPENQRQLFKELMTKHVNVMGLEKAMKETMIRYMTARELKALADFYGSQEGRSVLKKYGAITASLIPVLQAEAERATAEAMKELKRNNSKSVNHDGPR